MVRIDAHQHFWKFDPVREAWITEEMKRIRQDFLPEDLYPELTNAGFDGCIAVQADQSEQETEFLLELAAANKWIKGVVGWVDLLNDDVAARLEYFSRHEVLKGFRHILQGEPDRRYMLREDFQKGIAALADHGFTYDILIHNDQLQFVPQLVAAFPDLKFVIDHIGKPSIQKRAIDDWRKGMGEIAKHENVCCKVSGMTTEADWKSWGKKDFTPYLDAVVEAFGMKRLMFGSDWPVCLLAGNYRKTLEIVETYFENFSAAEQEAFFGGNAAAFYNI